MNLINQELVQKNKKYYTEKDTEFRFLLGGIGTGSISIGNRGQLCDWEIFNKPNKERVYPYAFFSLFSEFEGGKKEVRILEARLTNPHRRPTGYSNFELAGIPRFEHARLSGNGPYLELALTDKKLPLEVNLVAFSPLIPTDEDNSGIPAIHFNYQIKNISNIKCKIGVCATQSNYTAQDGFDLFGNMIIKGNQKNKTFLEDNAQGIDFSCDNISPFDLSYGTMSLFTTNKNVTIKPNWLKGGWCDGAHDFFDDFLNNGKLTDVSGISPLDKGKLEFVWKLKTGSIAINEELTPGETKNFEFVLSWNFPNRPKSWEGHICPSRPFMGETIKNYYAYRFLTAHEAGKYLIDHFDKLNTQSRNFVNALFSTTINKEFIDAINATLTVLRSTTCFRIGKEGRFLAWEGCFNDRGSCEGNCTHVWNYAQTLAYLFPHLEEDMRRTEFLTETDDEGNMAFRAMQIMGEKKWDMLPAADGQMGSIVRLFRDWKFSGNDGLLKECYPKMKKALNFAFNHWDSNHDYVLDSKQHNTYDIEFYGENSLTNSLFFAALLAGSKMAHYMNDAQSEDRWIKAFNEGSKRMDQMLFHNGYYIQNLKDINEFKYQYGKGCLSDQLFGQTLASLCGLGYIFPKEHIRSAIQNVYKNNFRRNFYQHINVQRTYALNNEKGLLVCSWLDQKDRPKLPFIYADEVWSGIEYQVATLLIYEGFTREALSIVKGIRGRYNGKNRNPFNEVECGNHYVRSLASYGLLIALSGYQYNIPNKTISFNPQNNGKEFTTFFTTINAFGLCRITGSGKNKKYEIQMLKGNLDNIKLV